MIAVHKDTHGKAENDDFPVGNHSYKATFLEEHPECFQEFRYQIECKLSSTAARFEEDGEGAEEARHHDIPTIDLSSIVLHNTGHVAEDGYIARHKHDRLSNILRQLL